MKFIILFLSLYSLNLSAKLIYQEEISNFPYHFRLKDSVGYYKVIDKEGNEYLTSNDQYTVSPKGKIVDMKGRILSPGIQLLEDTRYIEVNSIGEVTIETHSGKKEFVGIIEIFEIIDNKLVNVTGSPHKAVVKHGYYLKTNSPSLPFEIQVN